MHSHHITFREFKLLSLTIVLAICGSLGLDIHLASLPHIMTYMHTDRQHIQQSVTLFILGVGLSVLIYGPLSDKIGRRPVVILGLGIACLASYSAAWSQSITTFLILRLIQGMGCGVCWGLGRVISADILQGERLAALGSYFSLFLSLSPLLAPALGGYIQHWFGWQANFILLGSIILIALIILLIFLEETNKHMRPEAFSFYALFRTYGSFFHNRLFVGCALLAGIIASASFIYTTTSPFIFQQEFHTTPVAFGWLTAVVGLAGITGKLISPFFILRIKNQKTLITGISLLFASGVTLSIFTFSMIITIPILLMNVSTAIVAFVFIGGVSLSMALSPFHDKRGSAGALFTAFQLIISFVLSATVASFPHLGTKALAGSYVVLGALGFVCYFSFVRGTLLKSA